MLIINVDHQNYRTYTKENNLTERINAPQNNKAVSKLSMKKILSESKMSTHKRKR